MVRWLSLVGMVLGLTLGCDQSPSKPAEPTAKAAREAAEQPAPGADQAQAAGNSIPARTANLGDEGCPYAKQQQAAGDDCPCGKQDGTCAKDGRKGHTGCSGCDSSTEDDGSCGKKDSCGCSDEDKAGCPHTAAAPEEPHARLGGRCPFLAGHSGEHGRSTAAEETTDLGVSL